MEPKTSEIKTDPKAGKEKAAACCCASGETRTFFFSALLIVLVAIFSIVYFQNPSEDGTGGQEGVCNALSRTNKISIATDKASYLAGEKISLHLENLGTASVYSEPCKNISVFEKDEAGVWSLKQEEDIVISYKEGDFDKKEGNTDCQIEAPAAGSGTYRVVVPIYYGCTEPSRYACQGSEIFRSNEFAFTAAPAGETIAPAAE